MQLITLDFDPQPILPCGEAFIDNFLKRRSELIRSYEAGEMTKKDFLIKNFDLSNQSNIRPFTRVDSFEKGLFNYQYYNCLAKYYHALGQKARGKSNRAYCRWLSLSDKYYQLKDRAALALLELEDFEGVEAYYVYTDSRALSNRLFEVVMVEREEAIFHSVASWLAQVLKDRGVFKSETRHSLIEIYINDTYG